MDLADQPQQPQGSPVIRRKLAASETPMGAAPRERLDGLLRQLVDAHPVVAVTACAGAGK
jgi:hypothetical protein